MNDARLESILMNALAALEAGETVEHILARYPAEADSLRPALRVAARLGAHGQVTRQARPVQQLQARRAFLARAAALSPSARPTPRTVWWLRPATAFLTLAVLAVLVSGGVLSASAASLPGDPLYGVKRSFENLQLSLAFDPVRRVNLEETLRQRRTEEVKAVQTARRAAPIEFAAPIEVISPTMWIIGGVTVGVTPDTVIEGSPGIGDQVQVIGHTWPDGQVTADRIKAGEIDLSGVVESMSESVWTIKGQRVLVIRETGITGVAKLGALARVRARRLPDGTLLALKIEFDTRGVPTPASPTATPRPESSATPQPLKTTEPTETSEPHEPTETRTPRPTEPGESSRTPEATRTPRPPETVGPSRTPETPKTAEPTETREASRTPERTRSPEPTRTLQAPPTNQPTRTPEPEHTREPTETRRPPVEPEPTKTREPTQTPKP